MSDIYFLLTGYAKIFPFPLFHKISIAGPGIWYLAPLCSGVAALLAYNHTQ